MFRLWFYERFTSKAVLARYFERHLVVCNDSDREVPLNEELIGYFGNALEFAHLENRSVRILFRDHVYLIRPRSR